ncbi:MAG: tRNA pseudouridine(13) synthase TruD [Halobacteriales archaeon]|nr:tRNA pseudouridine(13) synthase TruD [Halobacteriales archaeon]
MREAYPVEQAVGIDYYVSDTDGIGGRLRETPDAFQVEEIERPELAPVDADPGDYRHLVVRVTLENWDTNRFAGTLADRLEISRERISWAGTKDKRAVTTQLLSIDGVTPDELPTIEDATIEPIGRMGRWLEFGDLVGNRFRIRVADPDHPEHASAITEELRAFGDGSVSVPNYFGQQRFGSRRPVTHEVGLAICRGEWEAAVMTYVGNPFDAEPPATRKARRFVEDTHDWTAALERMPDWLGHERAMLHRLAENGGTSDADFRAALEAVPSNLQRLFVNAAQSYVFNRILSERLTRGLSFTEAVAGDVVCFTETIDGVTVPDPDRLQRVTDSRVDAINRHLDRGRAVITAPLVGTETTLGDRRPGDIERTVLETVDIGPADFDLLGAFHSTGTRRAITLSASPTIEHDPLTFAFALPKGAYATVLLREYLKYDPIEAW